MPESALAPFVPAILKQRLARSGSDSAGPDSWRFSGVALVVDITGFTALTERLAQRGPGGAEALASILNDSFGDVIGRIHAHGGDVVSFAGDAILAVWPESASRAVAAAAACALESQRLLESRPAVEGIQVRARAGIDAGSMWVGVVGGVNHEWRWVVGGSPLAGAGRAAALAQPGELAISAAAGSLGNLGGRPVGDDGGHLVIESLQAAAMAPGHEMAASAESAPQPSDVVLASFLPRELVSRVHAGQTDWLAEFRLLTVLFVGIDGLDPRRPGAVELGQTAFKSAQEIINHYEGSLNQIVDDEKGLTIVASWGFPDRTHEDDQARGVLAAVAITDALSAMGLTAGAGVTNGVAFTGIRGSSERCEYAMVGDVVNLAARILHSGSAEVRCDGATARAAASRLGPAGLAARPIGILQLKGKASGVEAFRIERATQGEDHASQVRGDEHRPLIGRAAEWETLEERIGRFARDRRGGVVIIEGEPGVGKSQLVARLVAESPIRVHVSDADAIERSTAYYIWRRLLLELLGVEGTDQPAVEAAVMAALSDDPALQDRASLLDAILPVELPASVRAASLESDVRADVIRDLAVHLVAGAAAAEPRALVLEDVHWADSSSWALILAVARRVPDALLVLTTRPMGEDAPLELQRALTEPGATRISLGPLDAADAEALVCYALGVDALPTGVGVFIRDRAEGNPFFSEQLAFALRDAGHLVVEGRASRLASGLDLNALDIPKSIHGVIAGRIDGLSPSEQLTLKVASVIGRLFAVGILSDIHPLPEARSSIRDELARAEGLDLARQEAPEPDVAYLFTHVITQEVAYDLLVYAHRRPLHRAVAEWYEAHAADLEPHVPLLAHHWSRAGVVEKALDYLGRAGEQALLNYANAEAMDFLADALALDDANGRPTPATIRADWERWTGIALVKSARYREALPHFEACLELLGARNPRSRAHRLLSIWRHLGLQVWRRVHRSRIRESERNRALAISECHRYLAEVSYWRNDLFPMVHAMLASLNYAEPAGDSKESVFALASVGFLFGLVQMHPVARAYRRLTDAASERVGNPDAAGYAAELEGVYYLVVADWAAVHRTAQRGIAIFREIGDRMRWHTCHSHVGYAYLHRGDFDQARENATEAVEALGPEGALQSRLWSLSAILATELATDRLDVALARELAALIGPAVHHSDEILVRGLVAKALGRAGDEEAGREHALAIQPLIDAFPPPSFHSMLGIESAAEVLVDAWAAAPSDREARRLARHAISGLRRFALFNRAARPRASLLEGRARFLEGDQSRARRAWQRARSLASSLDMPYEMALADIELAASYPDASPERAAAAESALANLEACGAAFDEARARQLLGRPTEDTTAVSAERVEVS